MLVDVEHLARLLPNLHSLQTTRGILAVNENLARFVSTLVDAFQRLVQLLINEDGRMPLVKGSDAIFKETIVATGNHKLTDSSRCRITFPRKNILAIWLS